MKKKWLYPTEFLIFVFAFIIWVSMLSSNYKKAADNAKIISAKNTLTQIADAITVYYTEHDTYPGNNISVLSLNMPHLMGWKFFLYNEGTDAIAESVDGTFRAGWDGLFIRVNQDTTRRYGYRDKDGWHFTNSYWNITE